MNVEVLVIDGCPNGAVAADRTREALSLLGNPDTSEVTIRLIRSADEIVGTAFAGSPTIAVNGVDIFPTETQVTSLSCRVYSTTHGLSGAPSTEQIVTALRESI